jgi:two-component system sensor histidine kinase UhpB
MVDAPDHLPRRRMPLFWRVFLANAAILLSAWMILAFSPARVVSPLIGTVEGFAGVVGLSAMLVLNIVLMRRALGPVERLSALMRRIDPLRPGQRVSIPAAASAEVIELSRAFNEMLGRIERERRESARRALRAQEDERRRLSRELHDEIGQTLTGLVLELEYAVKTAPPDLAAYLSGTREGARGSLEDVRRVARRLRPEALDDLGLRSAVTNLCERAAEHSGFRVTRRIAPDLPRLSDEAELVVYRVAQESLTNAARHSDAANVQLELLPRHGGVLLRVADDGCGIAPGRGEGAGITGMRERAILVGAELTIAPSAAGGTCVELAVPGAESS